MTDLHVKSLQPVYDHCRSCLPQFALAVREADDRIEELVEANEKLRAALDAVNGFCRHCGASYPHREGEGRCEKCAALQEIDDD